MANNSKKIVNHNNNDQTVEVLYQKMGNRWFAFSLIDEEVFVGSISQEEIDEAAITGSPAELAQAIHGSQIGNS
jgi:hypothetical protein